MSRSLEVRWTEAQCREYRETINKLMPLRTGMRERCTANELAFFDGHHTEPFVLYRTSELPPPYETGDSLKDSAFQQIGILCGAIALSLATIHRDFSPQSESNQNMPQSTVDLFTYIDDNAEALVAEMCEWGLLEKCILAY